MTGLKLKIFVAAWQLAESVSEIADALKMSPAKAIAQAGYLRRNGVPLKKFQRGRRGYDWASLAEGL